MDKVGQIGYNLCIMAQYDAAKIEKKWQKHWEKKKAWKVDLSKAKKPYYNLMMFPYPSAEGLHVGNVYAFTSSDIHGRFERMRGNDVFEPMGFDAFGIHSENFAIKQGTHPKEQTAKNIKNFTKQLKRLGSLFDWEHSVTTSEPEYYKWTQWLFLQLYKAGLAYKQKAPVEWCPSCKTVLANEQVIEGKCERCSSEVIQKELEQWFFGITKYADRLLKNLDWIDWTEKTKIAQRNWIGRSEDTEIIFPLKGFDIQVPIITTRADTIFGATFLVLAPEHNLVQKFKGKTQNLREVEQYIKKAQKKSEFERGLGNKEKTGVELKGIIAINPVNEKEIPVFLADYVLATYGTGAIMGVPAHDDRDFVFAKKFKLPIISVIEEPTEKGVVRAYVYDNDSSDAVQELRELGSPMEYWTPTQRRYDISVKDADKIIAILRKANVGTKKQWESIRQGQSFALEMSPVAIDFGTVYAGEGKHINSEFLNGLDVKETIQKIVAWLKPRKLGKKSVHYHLRDWLISRQRYWGPPIPIIYCAKCGTVPVPEKDLPVLLPKVKDFRPSGTGKSPLASVASFVKTKCPKCKGPAERETDVSDTFLDSAWYFFRYPSTRSARSGQVPFEKKLTKKWLPVNMYIGGHEHAVLHLLYTRFITMALKDMGHIEFEEPFKKFRAHGLITKEGIKMSKSKGNVVNPDEYFVKYGADTVRTYLMFIGPLAEGGDWSDRGIVGISRFFNRLWSFVEEYKNPKKESSELEVLKNRTIKKVTEDLENLRYNTAIAALMEYSNAFHKLVPTKKQFSALLILLSPFAPHLAEELWSKFNKGSCHDQPWPKYDPKALQEKVVRLVVQVNGRVRDILLVSPTISEKEVVALALAQDKVKKWFPKGKPKNVVFVKGRILNLVSY